VAHTANDALEVIDCGSDRYLRSVPNLAGVAGALVSEERQLVFTSNRGENTVGIFPAGDEAGLIKVPVGVRPNGLAFDANRNRILAANVGDPAVPGSFTVSIVDVMGRTQIACIPVAGRTRWSVYDPRTDAFYVNIADPPAIVGISAADPFRVARSLPIPSAGPHGLDLDTEQHRLFCACDDRRLIGLQLPEGRVLSASDLSGAPDVIFFNAALHRLYVAIGNPGVIDVLDTETMRLVETVPTETGAHTLAFDPDRNKVYAFLPRTHRAAVYVDRG
jgi:DNA-binding beta-propeller fold protein YncE